MVQLILAVLLVLQATSGGTLAKSYMCFVDVCTEGVHFCDVGHRTCRRCNNYLGDCFTESHHTNCTTVCRETERSKLERQVLDKLRAQPCMSIPKLENGQHNGSFGNFSNGDVVMFTCDNEYRLVGANSVTCNDFGTWSAGLPTCDDVEAERSKIERQVLDKLRVKPCMPMPDLQYGQHNGSNANTSNGESVAFYCDSEYRLIGPNITTCNDFGTWSTGPPVCEGNQSIYGQFWCIASICTFILLILAMVVISILWCKVKRLKKKLPKKGNVQQDVESEGSSRTETPASVRRGPASKNDQAQQPLLPSGAAEGAGEPSQPGDSDETERKCSLDEDIEYGDHVIVDTSRESALFRGVQEERKGATGELHASARPVEPRPPDDEQSEEDRGDESLFCAQASSYHQQERPNEGTSNKIAMQRGGEVAPEDLGYTLSD